VGGAHGEQVVPHGLNFWQVKLYLNFEGIVQCPGISEICRLSLTATIDLFLVKENPTRSEFSQAIRCNPARKVFKIEDSWSKVQEMIDGN
jgi:hypothetical protein